MKLIKMLLLPVLFVAMWSLTGCNEEPTTSVTPDTTTSFTKLTIPAGAVITEATFNVFTTRSQVTTVNVHKVLVPWVEATETFNTFFAKEAPQWNATIEGSFDASSVGWKSVNITGLVQSWVADPTTNNGFILDQLSYPNCYDPLDPLFILYHSRENTTMVPYLEVTYTTAAGTNIVYQLVFEDTYLHSGDPDFPRGAVDVLFQTRWDDPSCTLLKLPLFKFELEQEQQEIGCETAFAFGDNIAPSKCFTELGFGNWGWSIKLSGPGSYTFPVYAGAGQCNIANGTYVGTVTANYTGGTVNFTYNFLPGFSTEEVHFYAGKTEVPRNNRNSPTVAPGQYKIGTGLTGEIYIIAHAVVCSSDF